MTDHHDPFDGTDDLAELRALASGMSLSEPEWEQPPPGLWDRIAAEVASDTDVDQTTRVPAPVAAPTANDESSPHHHGVEAPVAPVVPLSSRRRVPWLLGAVAAAAVLIVGAAVVLSRPTSSSPPVLASTELARLGDSGSGGAELVEVDGELRLRVDTADLDAGEGFLEVWMINTDVTQLVSLGPIRPDGDYNIPPGLDPEKFPVVDVSVEPLDGDPTHSGDSVLRGQLTF